MKLIKEQVALISDLHVGLHGSSTQWHKIILNFAHWLKETLLSNNIKDIIIAGDILDDRNEVPVTTLQQLSKFFEILDCFNIIVLVGNHDCYYNKRSDVHSLDLLDQWENITVIDKLTTITSHEKMLTFVPWNTPLDEIPNSDIIFGHFDIKTFKMNSRRICEYGINSNDLLTKADLIITGHFHLTEARKYSNGTIVYLGSPYEQNWGEANSPKGIYLLDIPTKNANFIPNLQSPRHRKVRLSELIAVGKLTSTIKKEFADNIVSFIVDAKANPQMIESLINKFSLLKPLELKVEYSTIGNIEVIDEIDFVFSGINIQGDIEEFIKNLENFDKKEELTNYLQEVYKKVETKNG